MGKQWPAFYGSVRDIAALATTRRDQRMRALLTEAGSTKTSSGH
jgi:predicted aminopeptidase